MSHWKKTLAKHVRGRRPLRRRRKALKLLVSTTGGRSARTYRGVERNRQFGRKPVGNTKPHERNAWSNWPRPA